VMPNTLSNREGYLVFCHNITKRYLVGRHQQERETPENAEGFQVFRDSLPPRARNLAWLRSSCRLATERRLLLHLCGPTAWVAVFISPCYLPFFSTILRLPESSGHFIPHPFLKRILRIIKV